MPDKLKKKKFVDKEEDDEGDAKIYAASTIKFTPSDKTRLNRLQLMPPPQSTSVAGQGVQGTGQIARPGGAAVPPRPGRGELVLLDAGAVRVSRFEAQRGHGEAWCQIHHVSARKDPLTTAPSFGFPRRLRIPRRSCGFFTRGSSPSPKAVEETSLRECSDQSR
jgi:hypothetical protein